MDGWDHIIHDAASQLPSWVQIVEIKEKYGGLDIKLSYSSAKTDEIIRWAREKSLATCESCGKIGVETMLGYWVKTLCHKCHETYLRSQQ